MSLTSSCSDLRVIERRRPARLFTRYSVFGGRRRLARRRDDRLGYVADQHGTWLFVAALTIAALNILDAFYTVLFLGYGGIELNPVVEWLLDHGGPWSFIAVKSLGIGVCVAFLTLTKNFVVSRLGLAVVLLGYGGLLAWHLHLTQYLPT